MSAAPRVLLAELPDAPAEVQLEFTETYLGIRLPDEWRTVLLAGDDYDGRLATLPAAMTTDSILGATLRLREVRPDLEHCVAVMPVIDGSPIVCTDIRDPLQPLLVAFHDGEDLEQIDDTLFDLLRELSANSNQETKSQTSLAVDRPSVADQLELLVGYPVPGPLRSFLNGPGKALAGIACTTRGDEARPPHVLWAVAELALAQHPLPAGLVPIALVDDRSFACAVIAPEVNWQDRRLERGWVVRWHLDPIRTSAQGALLDRDTGAYLASLRDEISARPRGLQRMRELSTEYDDKFLKTNSRPRDFERRPLRIACQNVVIALGAFAQDAGIDGLRVPAFMTCEAPHVVTHEGNRVLTALMLCDAYRNGGTLEIRFDGPRHFAHPEGQVPASLCRFARVHGIELGTPQDAAGITPRQARELFLAVTPMPQSLRARVDDVIDRGLATPERICFSLLTQTFSPIEVDFMLVCSDRAMSVLRGGASWEDRSARAAEVSLARAARIAGTMYKRLDTLDLAASDEDQRPIEDKRIGVRWEVLEDVAAIKLQGVEEPWLPWVDSLESSVELDGSITIVPRATITPSDIEVTSELGTAGPAALVVPAETNIDAAIAAGVPVATCPYRLGELDARLEQDLLNLRISRA